MKLEPSRTSFLLTAALLCTAAMLLSCSAKTQEPDAVQQEESQIVAAQEEALPVIEEQEPVPTRDTEWEVTLLYEPEEQSSLVTEVAPYVYEADLYKMLHVHVFTPEQLGERFKFKKNGTRYSALIYNEDIQTSFFYSHNEAWENTFWNLRYSASSNPATNTGTGTYVVPLPSGEEGDDRILLVLLDLETDAVKQLIVMDEISGALSLEDDFIDITYDGMESYQYRTIALYMNDLYDSPANAFIAEEVQRDELPGISRSRQIQLMEYATITFTKRTAEPLTVDGTTAYWYSRDGNGWYPGTSVYLMPGTFELLAPVELPAVEKPERGAVAFRNHSGRRGGSSIRGFCADAEAVTSDRNSRTVRDRAYNGRRQDNLLHPVSGRRLCFCR